MTEVTSGSFNTLDYTTGGKTRDLTFSWERISYSVENNTSTISYTLKGTGTYTGWINTRNIKLSVNGTTVYSAAGPIKVYNGTVLKSGTITIKHNDNGGKSFSASVECGIYYSTINSTGSGSWTLKSIPRASTITVADGYIGEQTTLTIAKANSSFTHTFSYKCVDNVDHGLNVTMNGNTGTFTIPTAIYEKIPNDPSVEVRVVCYTWYNGTKIGTSYTPITAKVKEQTNRPDVSYESIKDVVSNTITVTNDPTKFIKGLSRPEVKGINVTTKNHATIKSIIVKCGDLSIEAYKNGAILNPVTFLQYITSGTITITAIDSRGLSTTVTHTATMYDYFQPSLTVRIQRVGQTGNTVKAEYSGKFYIGEIAKEKTLKFLYTDENGNSKWVEIARRNADGTTTVSQGTFTINGNDFSGSLTLQDFNANNKLENIDFDYRKEHTITFQLQDSNIQAIQNNCTLLRGIPVFDWGENDFNFNVPVTFQAAVNFAQPATVDDDPVVDTVIEQGKKNVTDPNTNATVAWDYRKWESGMAECWIRRNVNVNVNTAWGSTGFYYGTISTINFPFKFAEVPTVTVTVEYGDDSKSLFIASSGYSSQNYARPTMLCRNSAETVNCNLNYHVTGRWK